MRYPVAVASLLALTLTAAGGVADPKGEAKSGSREIRRDPENKRGISPYMETVVKGEAAYVARDIPGAVASFQDAIKQDASQMLAFYRLGEGLRELGKLDDADAAWQTGLSKKGPEDLNAKLLFVIADLRERQHKWQAAKDAWASYSAYLATRPKVVGFPATAIERQKQLERRMKLEVDYGAVKDRIAKRIQEKEAEATENAKKDKLNR